MKKYWISPAGELHESPGTPHITSKELLARGWVRVSGDQVTLNSIDSPEVFDLIRDSLLAQGGESYTLWISGKPILVTPGDLKEHSIHELYAASLTGGTVKTADGSDAFDQGIFEQQPSWGEQESAGSTGIKDKGLEYMKQDRLPEVGWHYQLMEYLRKNYPGKKDVQAPEPDQGYPAVASDVVSRMRKKSQSLEEEFIRNRELCRAAFKGDLEKVKLLVEQGADVNVNEDYPLRAAHSYGYMAIIKYLMEHGAGEGLDPEIYEEFLKEIGQTREQIEKTRKFEDRWQKKSVDMKVRKKADSEFDVGDIVKLRPDVLQRHSRSIPAHMGYSHGQFVWRDILGRLSNKEGRIEKLRGDSADVQFSETTIYIELSELVLVHKGVSPEEWEAKWQKRAVDLRVWFKQRYGIEPEDNPSFYNIWKWRDEQGIVMDRMDDKGKQIFRQLSKEERETTQHEITDINPEQGIEKKAEMENPDEHDILRIFGDFLWGDEEEVKNAREWYGSLGIQYIGGSVVPDETMLGYSLYGSYGYQGWKFAIFYKNNPRGVRIQYLDKPPEEKAREFEQRWQKKAELDLEFAQKVLDEGEEKELHPSSRDTVGLTVGLDSPYEDHLMEYEGKFYWVGTKRDELKALDIEAITDKAELYERGLKDSSEWESRWKKKAGTDFNVGDLVRVIKHGEYPVAYKDREVGWIAGGGQWVIVPEGSTGLVVDVGSVTAGTDDELFHYAILKVDIEEKKEHIEVERDNLEFVSRPMDFESRWKKLSTYSEGCSCGGEAYPLRYEDTGELVLLCPDCGVEFESDEAQWHEPGKAREFEQRWKKRSSLKKKADEISIWDMPEYRLEFEAVGQGHYHRLPNDELAIEKAIHLSLDYPGEVVVLEQFKPIRRLIGWYERGKEIKNPEKTRKFEQRWQKRSSLRKKADLIQDVLNATDWDIKNVLANKLIGKNVRLHPGSRYETVMRDVYEVMAVNPFSEQMDLRNRTGKWEGAHMTEFEIGTGAEEWEAKWKKKSSLDKQAISSTTYVNNNVPDGITKDTKAQFFVDNNYYGEIQKTYATDKYNPQSGAWRMNPRRWVQILHTKENPGHYTLLDSQGEKFILQEDFDYKYAEDIADNRLTTLKETPWEEMWKKKSSWNKIAMGPETWARMIEHARSTGDWTHDNVWLPIYEKAVGFINKLLEGGVPLDAIFITDFQSSTPRIYINAKGGRLHGGYVPSGWSDYRAGRIIKKWKRDNFSPEDWEAKWKKKSGKQLWFIYDENGTKLDLGPYSSMHQAIFGLLENWQQAGDDECPYGLMEDIKKFFEDKGYKFVKKNVSDWEAKWKKKADHKLNVGDKAYLLESGYYMQVSRLEGKWRWTGDVRLDAGSQGPVLAIDDDWYVVEVIYRGEHTKVLVPPSKIEIEWRSVKVRDWEQRWKKRADAPQPPAQPQQPAPVQPQPSQQAVTPGVGQQQSQNPTETQKPSTDTQTQKAPVQKKKNVFSPLQDMQKEVKVFSSIKQAGDNPDPSAENNQNSPMEESMGNRLVNPDDVINRRKKGRGGPQAPEDGGDLRTNLPAGLNVALRTASDAVERYMITREKQHATEPQIEQELKNKGVPEQAIEETQQTRQKNLYKEVV